VLPEKRTFSEKSKIIPISHICPFLYCLRRTQSANTHFMAFHMSFIPFTFPARYGARIFSHVCYMSCSSQNVWCVIMTMIIINGTLCIISINQYFISDCVTQCYIYMNVRIYVIMYAYMYVYMYACVYIFSNFLSGLRRLVSSTAWILESCPIWSMDVGTCLSVLCLWCLV
jgi:hypothetical protein